MKQTLNEYIEGRLELGGCCLSALGVAFVAFLLFYGANRLMNNWDEYLSGAFFWLKAILFGALIFVVVAALLLTIFYLWDRYKKYTPVRMAKHEYNSLCEQSGMNSPSAIGALSQVAIEYFNLEDYKKALPLFEKAYSLQCQVLGEDHEDTLVTLVDLALTNSNLENHQTAAELHEKAYTLRCKVLGKENEYTLESLNYWVVQLSCLGQHKKTLELGTELYALSKKVFGEEHDDTINALYNLAHSFYNNHDYKSALELYKKVYSLNYRILGADHPETQAVSEYISLAQKGLAENQQ